MKRKPKYTVEEIRERVAPIAKRHGVERVYLFGSYARGDARAKSDIDLRIDEGRADDYFKLGGVYCDLEEALGKTKVDLLLTGGIDEEILEDISKEEVLLYAEHA